MKMKFTLLLIFLGLNLIQAQFSAKVGSPHKIGKINIPFYYLASTDSFHVFKLYSENELILGKYSKKLDFISMSEVASPDKKRKVEKLFGVKNKIYLCSRLDQENGLSIYYFSILNENGEIVHDIEIAQLKAEKSRNRASVEIEVSNDSSKIGFLATFDKDNHKQNIEIYHATLDLDLKELFGFQYSLNLNQMKSEILDYKLSNEGNPSLILADFSTKPKTYKILSFPTAKKGEPYINIFSLENIDLENCFIFIDSKENIYGILKHRVKYKSTLSQLLITKVSPTGDIIFTDKSLEIPAEIAQNLINDKLLKNRDGRVTLADDIMPFALTENEDNTYNLFLENYKYADKLMGRIRFKVNYFEEMLILNLDENMETKNIFGMNRNQIFEFKEFGGSFIDKNNSGYIAIQSDHIKNIDRKVGEGLWYAEENGNATIAFLELNKDPKLFEILDHEAYEPYRLIKETLAKIDNKKYIFCIANIKLFNIKDIRLVELTLD